jgi:hypothetical protein
VTCAACDGPFVLLGVLGDLAHLRCRCCGLQASVDAADLELG